MAISNLALDCATYNYQNVISFDYAGAGTSADIYVDYGNGSVFLQTISPLNGLANQYFDDDTPYVCASTADYTIYISDSSGSELESGNISCTNTCIPEDVNLDFEVDCATATNKGFDATLTEFSGNSNLDPYIFLRIYRSTEDPSTLTLPDAAYSLIDTLPYNTTEWTDSTASADTEYWYEAEYYNALNGAVSANIRTSGPCTTFNNSCGNAFPLHEFEFDISNSDCSQLVISDLFTDSVDFKIPEQYTCFNISSITSIKLNIWDNCLSNETNSQEINISPSISQYNPLTKDIEVGLNEGVYKVKLTVIYKDSFNNTKTITHTKCVFICGDLKCDIATLLASDINNAELASLYHSLEFLAECDSCYSACEVYQYLKNYEGKCC